MLEIPLSIYGEQLIIGLVLGTIYVLLALGLTVIFGLLGVVNFAHGAFYLLGAYLAYVFMRLTGNFVLALVTVPVIVMLIGMESEKFLLRPIYERGYLYPLCLTFGISIFIPDLVRIIFGLTGKSVGIPEGLRSFLRLGSLYLPIYNIFILLLTLAALICFWLFLTKTNLGMIIRAGTRDNLMVQLLGINIYKVWTITFGIGVGLAALAGVMVAPIRGVRPAMGGTMLIESFAVVVIGGMGSLKGAIVGGILVGEIVALASLLWGEIGYLAIFIFMVVVLLIRPRGLFGEAGLME